MRIAEIYESIQGEGLLTGTPSVFVRTSGCNLRCHFCDTPFASWRPEGDDWGLDEIAARVLDYGTEHVVLTGGEPMIFAELVPLCERLADASRHLTIETAGTLYLAPVCDLMSISPKLNNSSPSAESSNGWRRRHDATRDQRHVVRRLMEEYPYQLKFVVGCRGDADEALVYLESLPKVDRGRVWMMPEGTELERLSETADWLVAFCDAHQLVYCPRRQIEWFGNLRGT